MLQKTGADLKKSLFPSFAETDLIFENLSLIYDRRDPRLITAVKKILPQDVASAQHFSDLEAFCKNFLLEMASLLSTTLIRFSYPEIQFPCVFQIGQVELLSPFYPGDILIIQSQTKEDVEEKDFFIFEIRILKNGYPICFINDLRRPKNQLSERR